MKPTVLFPVFNDRYAEFFVSPAQVAPMAVDYEKDDPFGRGFHVTQLLQVPVTVPNYFALCAVPGQTPWGTRDEIDLNTLRAKRVAFSVQVGGEERVILIDTKGSHLSGFSPVPDESSSYVMHMWLTKVSGLLDSQDGFGELLGDSLFADFKAAGYDPMFNVGVTATYCRQRCALAVVGSSVHLISLKNRQTKIIVPVEDVHQSVRPLLNKVREGKVIGVEFSQQLA